MQNFECEKLILSKNKAVVAIHRSVLFDSVKFSYYDELLSELNHALQLASSHIKFSYLDINIVPNQAWLIMPEFGFGAITYSPNLLYISVDSRACTKKAITEEFGAMVVHELNHVARLAKLNIENWDEVTFLEDAIQEGIAVLFQELLYPKSALYINNDVMDDIDGWIGKATKIYNKKRNDYDRDGWFFGSKTLPRWAGYTIGYHLVKKYYNSNKITLQKLTELPAEKFI